MVGIGPKGSVAILGRVAVVDHQGDILLDTVVQPTGKVTDYRSWITGLRKRDFMDGKSYYNR